MARLWVFNSVQKTVKPSWKLLVTKMNSWLASPWYTIIINIKTSMFGILMNQAYSHLRKLLTAPDNT